MAKKVRFPMFFQVCAYQEIDLPETVEPFDEEDVLEYIDRNWDDIPLPDSSTWDYISGTCWPDPDAGYEIIDG